MGITMQRTNSIISPRSESGLQRFAKQHPRINSAIILLGVLASLILIVQALMGNSHWIFGAVAALVLLLQFLLFWVTRPH
jgi:hypothetical protein